MKMLFTVSIASGYGGAERRIELTLRQLPPGAPLQVYAENEFHLDRLTQPSTLPIDARLIRVSSTSAIWYDHDYIIGRLSGTMVMAPSAGLVERSGYLTPLYIEPIGAIPKGQTVLAKSHGIIGNSALNKHLHRLVDLLEINDCYAFVH